MDKSAAIAATQNWLLEIVIGHNFCPFAKLPTAQGRVRFAAIESKKQADILAALIEECQFLDVHSETDTSLLVLTRACADFNQYLNLLDIANDLLAASHYEGVYQLASFHPQYCFDGCEVDNVANYTNRSPYPIFHLIREEALAALLESVTEPELIPQRNIEKCEALGLTYFQMRFSQGFE